MTKEAIHPWIANSFVYKNTNCSHLNSEYVLSSTCLGEVGKQKWVGGFKYVNHILIIACFVRTRTSNNIHSCKKCQKSIKKHNYLLSVVKSSKNRCENRFSSTSIIVLRGCFQLYRANHCQLRIFNFLSYRHT